MNLEIILKSLWLFFLQEINYHFQKNFKKFLGSMNETNTVLKPRVEVTSSVFEDGGGTLFF